MRHLRLVLAGVLCLLPLASAQASMNSAVDYSVSRIVPVFNGNGHTTSSNGSGFLYAPRIVFSAGHMAVQPAQWFVGAPASKLSEGMSVARVVKTFSPSTYDNSLYTDDFAIFILDRELAPVSRALLIGKEQLDGVIAAGAQVKVTGYGVFEDACVLLQQVQRCDSSRLAQSPEPRSILMTPITMASLGENFTPIGKAKVLDHLLVKSDYMTGPCAGDSGGSTTVQIAGVEYYIGTTPSGFWGGYTCGASPPDRGIGYTLGYIAPVYKFDELIAQAEQFVAANPLTSAIPSPVASPAAKRTITCVKGKIVKKVSAVSPKCPSGYRKR